MYVRITRTEHSVLSTQHAALSASNVQAPRAAPDAPTRVPDLRLAPGPRRRRVGRDDVTTSALGTRAGWRWPTQLGLLTLYIRIATGQYTSHQVGLTEGPVLRGFDLGYLRSSFQLRAGSFQ